MHNSTLHRVDSLEAWVSFNAGPESLNSSPQSCVTGNRATLHSTPQPATQRFVCGSSMNANTAIRRLATSSKQIFRQYHAPIRIQQPALTPRRNLCIPPTQHHLRKRWRCGSIAQQIRHESSNTGERPLTDREAPAEENATSEKDEIAARKAQEPAYELVCAWYFHPQSHHTY